MFRTYFYILILLIEFANGTAVKAQTNIWEKYYFDYNNISSNIRNAITDINYDTTNNKFIFWGLSYVSSGRLSAYEISDSGNLVFRNYLIGLGPDGITFKFTTDRGVLVSSFESFGPYVGKTVYKLDSASNILWKRKYDVPMSPGTGLYETRNNEIIVTCTAHFTSYIRPILIKTDSLGNILTVKYYTNLFVMTRTAIQTHDDNYLFSGNSYLGEGFIIVKTDTSGHVLWSKSYMRPQGVVIDLLEKENGNLILAGNTDTTDQTQYPKLFIMELDTAGNTIWTKTYGDASNRMVSFGGDYYYYDPLKIKRTIDGGFVVVASFHFQGFGDDLVLLKTDSTGNLQWERRHSNSGDYETGINLIQTPDTGYFVVGSFFRNSMQAGYYLLKTDSLGSVGCNEYSDTIVVNSLLPTDSVIAVTDSVIVINQYIASVRDTTAPPPDSLPGCIPVNIKEFYKNWFTPVVFPNPTAGVFHVTIPEGMEGEKNIFVYDLLGKEIYSTQNSTERLIDIDLSKNAKGIYLLTVSTAKERAAVKVVVY